MNVLEDNLYTRSWQKLGRHCHARKRLWWFRLTGLPVERSDRDGDAAHDS